MALALYRHYLKYTNTATAAAAATATSGSTTSSGRVSASAFDTLLHELYTIGRETGWKAVHAPVAAAATATTSAAAAARENDEVMRATAAAAAAAAPDVVAALAGVLGTMAFSPAIPSASGDAASVLLAGPGSSSAGAPGLVGHAADAGPKSLTSAAPEYQPLLPQEAPRLASAASAAADSSSWHPYVTFDPPHDADAVGAPFGAGIVGGGLPWTTQSSLQSGPGPALSYTPQQSHYDSNAGGPSGSWGGGNVADMMPMPPPFPMPLPQHVPPPYGGAAQLYAVDTFVPPPAHLQPLGQHQLQGLGSVPHGARPYPAAPGGMPSWSGGDDVEGSSSLNVDAEARVLAQSAAAAASVAPPSRRSRNAAVAVAPAPPDRPRVTVALPTGAAAGGRSSSRRQVHDESQAQPAPPRLPRASSSDGGRTPGGVNESQGAPLRNAPAKSLAAALPQALPRTASAVQVGASQSAQDKASRASGAGGDASPETGQIQQQLPTGHGLTVAAAASTAPSSLPQALGQGRKAAAANPAGPTPRRATGTADVVVTAALSGAANAGIPSASAAASAALNASAHSRLANSLPPGASMAPHRPVTATAAPTSAIPARIDVKSSVHVGTRPVQSVSVTPAAVNVGNTSPVPTSASLPNASTPAGASTASVRERGSDREGPTPQIFVYRSDDVAGVSNAAPSPVVAVAPATTFVQVATSASAIAANQQQQQQARSGRNRIPAAAATATAAAAAAAGSSALGVRRQQQQPQRHVSQAGGRPGGGTAGGAAGATGNAPPGTGASSRPLSYGEPPPYTYDDI